MFQNNEPLCRLCPELMCSFVIDQKNDAMCHPTHQALCSCPSSWTRQFQSIEPPQSNENDLSKDSQGDFHCLCCHNMRECMEHFTGYESYFVTSEILLCTSHLGNCGRWMVMSQVIMIFEKKEGARKCFGNNCTILKRQV